jgi:hypothetical protein
MPRDPEKARARKRRYLDRIKADKYGPDSIGVDMRGRHENHARGRENGRWNDERIVSEHGYIRVRVGREHLLADPNGYAYEHLLVWVSNGNLLPGPDELIHHQNEDKTDNRIGNLQLLTRSAHALHHDQERVRDRAGRWTADEFPAVVPT